MAFYGRNKLWIKTSFITANFDMWLYYYGKFLEEAIAVACWRWIVEDCLTKCFRNTVRFITYGPEINNNFCCNFIRAVASLERQFVVSRAGNRWWLDSACELKEYPARLFWSPIGCGIARKGFGYSFGSILPRLLLEFERPDSQGHIEGRKDDKLASWKNLSQDLLISLMWRSCVQLEAVAA